MIALYRGVKSSEWDWNTGGGGLEGGRRPLGKGPYRYLVPGSLCFSWLFAVCREDSAFSWTCHWDHDMLSFQESRNMKPSDLGLSSLELGIRISHYTSSFLSGVPPLWQEKDSKLLLPVTLSTCVLRTLRKNNALFIEKQILICHIILITKQFQDEIHPKIILPEYCYEEIHSSPIHFNSQNVQLCLVWEKKCVFRAHLILNHFVFQPVYAIPKGGCERTAKSREAALLSSQLSISLVHLANTLKAKRGKACL